MVVLNLGGIDRATNEELNEITIVSYNFIIHSAYNSQLTSNDIALIRIEEPVTLSIMPNIVICQKY
jgi:Trypsin